VGTLWGQSFSGLPLSYPPGEPLPVRVTRCPLNPEPGTSRLAKPISGHRVKNRPVSRGRSAAVSHVWQPGALGSIPFNLMKPWEMTFLSGLHYFQRL
jgi:hypothetical protein